MKTRKLAVHGMSYGELAIEACTIVGGAFITLSTLLLVLMSFASMGVNGWIVVGIPLVATAAAVLGVWRLGFGALDAATLNTVVPSILIVGGIAFAVVPMIVGTMLVPAGGVPLLWVVFGGAWGIVALAAVFDAVRDWSVTGPTSVPLDIAAIIATVSALGCAGWMLSLGLTGPLYGIVLLGAMLGMSIGFGFFTAEELVEPEAQLEHADQTRETHYGGVAHA